MMQSAAPAFDATPDVSGEARDLRFRPADPDAAGSLCAGQVESFNRDGYVAPLPCFDPGEADRVRARPISPSPAATPRPCRRGFRRP